MLGAPCIGSKRHGIETDLETLGRVSRRHFEAARRLGDQAHDHLALEAHSLALHVGAGLAPLPQRCLISEVNPDLAQDRRDAR